MTNIEQGTFQKRIDNKDKAEDMAYAEKDLQDSLYDAKQEQAKVVDGRIEELENNEDTKPEYLEALKGSRERHIAIGAFDAIGMSTKQFEQRTDELSGNAGRAYDRDQARNEQKSVENDVEKRKAELREEIEALEAEKRAAILEYDDRINKLKRERNGTYVPDMFDTRV